VRPVRQLCALCWLIVLLLTSCHREIEDVPLIHPKISLADKFYDVQALSPDKAVVVGYRGKILMTTDGGKSWQERPSGTEQALYGIHFVDDQTGWITGQMGLILHTSDGGETWQKQPSGTDVSLFSLFFLDKTQGWVVGDRAVYLKTTSGGESWEIDYFQPSLEGVREDVALAIVDPILYDVHFLDSQMGWMVGEFGMILHTTDGGATWQEQQNSLLGQGGVLDAFEMPSFFSVHFINPQEGVAVGLDEKIALTVDGGQKWTFAPEDPSIFLPEPLYNLHLFADGNGWVVGSSGIVMRSQDGEWKKTDLGMEIFTWLRAVDFFDEQNGWIVGGYGLILHTTDGGRTWLPAVG
jgi:photosystem II stability/assembly factor-like uncharacterized protein